MGLCSDLGPPWDHRRTQGYLEIQAAGPNALSVDQLKFVPLELDSPSDWHHFSDLVNAQVFPDWMAREILVEALYGSSVRPQGSTARPLPANLHDSPSAAALEFFFVHGQGFLLGMKFGGQQKRGGVLLRFDERQVLRQM